MKLYRLGNSPRELEAAVLLAGVRGVVIDAVDQVDGTDRLLANGFVRLPRTIETVLALPFEPERRARPFRRNLAHSLRVWSDANAMMMLMPAADVDPALIDRLYFDLFVPRLYARGWSPFGIHNQRAFRDLLDDQCWVGLVMSGDRLLGGSLLSQRSTPHRARLAGSVPPEPSLTGMAYVLDDCFAQGRRALLAKHAEAAAARGFRSLSLGTDLPWMQAPYASALIEKLGWADAVLFDAGPPASWANFDRCGEDLLYFRRTDTGLDLCGAPSLAGQMRRIERRIVALRDH